MFKRSKSELRTGEFVLKAGVSSPISCENLSKIFDELSRQVLLVGKPLLPGDDLNITVKFRSNFDLDV